MTGTSIKTLLAFALLVGAASQANADIWDHVDRQANDIERAAKKLRQEVDHYRHTRFYGQLIGATARLKGQAIHVHNIADHSHCPIALKAAVKELGRAFHDAEELFDRTEHGAAFGNGYIRGNTAHVKQLLNRIETCIYNLQDDVRRLARVERARNQSRHNVYRSPVPVQRVYSPQLASDVYRGGYDRLVPGYGGYGVDLDRGRGCRSPRDSGFGISIGGGSSRITFRF